MKKKLLCLLIAILTLVCLQTAVLAEDEDVAVDGGLVEKVGQEWEARVDFSFDGPGQAVLIKAMFNESGDGAPVEWAVLDGKDVVSLSKRDGAEAILTALSPGEATIAAYLEDDSQSVIVAKVAVEADDEVGKPLAPFARLTVGPTKGGKVFLSEMDSSGEPFESEQMIWYEVGTVLKLTADDSSGVFKYWVVHEDNKSIIVSAQKAYEFVLKADMHIEAVFDQSEAENKKFNVAFLHDYFQILHGYVQLVEVPKPKLEDVPYRRNMEFKGWTSEQVDADKVLLNQKVNPGEITENTIFNAVYASKGVTCNITVVGGSGSGTYDYGEAVTAKVNAQPEAGKQFLFWSKDGAPVSYDAEYKFSAMQDCTVTAIFGAAVDTDGINMVMQNPVVDGDTIAFTFERYVPENYAFFSSGFIVGDNADCKLGDESNYMEATSYRTGVHTQFTKSLKTNGKAKSYYARGYVIYKDGETVKTIYTPSKNIEME